MQLAPPTFVEPLSVCSRAIRLQGQLPGSSVEVRGSGGRSIGHWVADWPDQSFVLDPGISLDPGEPVQAKQTLGADASVWTGQPMTVQDAGPSEPLFVLPIKACSDVVTLQGVAPGATVTVIRKPGGAVLGTATGGTTVTVPLSSSLTTFTRIVARTTPCGGAPGKQTAEPPIEEMTTVEGTRQLVNATLDPPLRSCQIILTGKDFQPGTSLLLKRDDGTVTTWQLNARQSNLRLSPELREGEFVEWWTEAPPRCELIASDPSQAFADSTAPVAPVITTDPCPGSPTLHCGGLERSATVRIRVDGVDSLEFAAADADQDVDISGLALVAGQRLTAVQRFCHDWSDASPPVLVSKPWGLTAEVTRPVADCAPYVLVSSVSPGSTVIVRSRNRKGELGRAVASGTAVAVSVNPHLDAGDTIEVQIVGCDPATLDADVEPALELPTPRVAQAYIGARTIVIDDVVPGATVDVRVNGKWSAGAVAHDDTVDVVVPTPLGERDEITLTVRLCADQINTEPVSPTKPPAPNYVLLQPGGIDTGGGNWASGQVEKILAAPGDILVLGCREAGVWISHPNGSAEPVGYGWKGAQVLDLAADPSNPVHVFAATSGGLRETNPSAADPLHSWRDVTLPAAAGVYLNSVTITADRVVVIAATTGLYWSPIPGGAALWNWQTDPAVARNCSSVVAVTGGVVAVAASPAALFRGEWTGATFGWADHASTAPAVFTARLGRTILAACAGNRNHVYALSADNANDQILGVLRSKDGGKTWACPHLGIDPALNRFQLSQPWDMGLQAPRDLGIAVHPTNPEQIVLAGRRSGLIGSTNGGADFDTAGWAPVLDATFHGDNRLVTYDTSTGTPRVLVGSDGGAFVSTDQDGKSWTSVRNRGLSTLMIDAGQAPSMDSAADFPGSCSVGLQDNGEAWTVGGVPWTQRIGGDGNRQVVVEGRYLFHADNDPAPLQWSEWKATELGPSHEVVRPADPPQPTFEAFIGGVVHPWWTDGSGQVLVAYIAESVGSPPTPNLYGVFDAGPGAGDARFVGRLLSALPGAPSGVASWQGRIAVVGTVDAAGVPHVFRYDAAASALVEMPLPGGTTGAVIWPTMMSGDTAVAVVNGDLIWSDGLLSWTHVDGVPAGVIAIGVDRAEHPPAVHVGTDADVFVLRESAAIVTRATGLPAEARTRQMTVVADANGDRWAYLGSWAWSVWRARLS